MIHRGTVGSFMGVVHLLRVANLCQNNMLTGNDKSVDALYKSRDQLVICLKTFKGFKLFLCVVAGFKNKIRNEVNRLGWRKTFGIVILG